MTKNDYERSCNTAALGLVKLAAVDAKITETEQALVFLLHARREIVNQYDLNKPACYHLWVYHELDGADRCVKCGAPK